MYLLSVSYVFTLSVPFSLPLCRLCKCVYLVCGLCAQLFVKGERLLMLRSLGP